MSAYFTAGDKTIRATLADGVRYVIPNYQRPYAWPQTLALQLLEDVVAAMERGRMQGPAGGAYFLGSVIVAKSSEGEAACVVDGQQRLLTLTILMGLLRDLCPDPAIVSAAAAAVADAMGRGRIEPRARDAAFFKEFVQERDASTREPADLVGLAGAARMPEGGDAESRSDEEVMSASAEGEDETDDYEEDGDEDDDDEGDADSDDLLDVLPDTELAQVRSQPAHDSQRAILDNRNALRRRLQEMTAEGHNLAHLTRFLLDNCYVVLVTVPDNAEAHRVFTVMHTRGLDLEETDVLKSEVLGAITDPGEAARYLDLWEETEARLGREQFVRLFSYLRLILLKRKARGSVFTEIRDALAPTREPARFVDGHVIPFGRVLDVVRRADYDLPGIDPGMKEEINRRLLGLSLLPNETWIPLAMLILHRFGQDPKMVAGLIRHLDELAYGLFFLRPTHAGGEPAGRFIDALRAIESGTDLPAIVASGLGLQPEEKIELRSSLARGSFSNKRRRLTLMRRLDAEHLPAGTTLPDYRGTNIEHVLPENPPRRSSWHDFAPNPGKFLQKFGNFILLSEADNTQAGNREFDEKKDIYFAPGNTSPFALKAELEAITHWSPEVVTERGKRFEKMLVELWDLPAEAPGTKKGKKRRGKRSKDKSATVANTGQAKPSPRKPAHLGGKKR